MSRHFIRQADDLDIDAIVALVNAAYRPQPGAEGWTHESRLIDGERISAQQVRHALEQAGSYVLLLVDGEQLQGCINVTRDGNYAYIGMLAVNPSEQSAGLGKQLLAAAETYSRQYLGIENFRMIVLSSRHELIAFYLRRGYYRTGQVMDYPLHAGVGTPKQGNETIETLEKTASDTPEVLHTTVHP